MRCRCDQQQTFKSKEGIRPCSLLPLAEKMKAVQLSMCFSVAVMMGLAVADSRAPIGVFDSGVGGLTVLDKLLSVDVVNNATDEKGADGIPDLQGEKFVQLADQANLHYGSYAAAGSAAFLRELSIRDAFFLLSPGYYRNAAEDIPGGRKTPAKIVVVACNTATAYGFAGIESSLRNVGSPVRVVGVVKAGSRAAVACVEENPQALAIGVLSTPGTFSSGVYPKTITAEASRKGIPSPRVVARGCANLADSIQFVKSDAEDLVRQYFTELVDDLRQTGATEKLRAVIFGCTHYPLARRHFEKVLSEIRTDPLRSSYLANEFTFVDPAVETAVECREILSSEGLLARREGPSDVEMFVSVPSASLSTGRIGADGTLEDGYKYMRKPGRDVVDTKFVPLAVGLRDRGKFASLLGILPAVNAHLKGW